MTEQRDEQARIRELEGALRFYADSDNYQARDLQSVSQIEYERGFRARQVLATSPPDSEPAEGESDELPNCDKCGDRKTRYTVIVCPKCDVTFHDRAPPQRRDAGDALREKLADPEAMQRVAERATEQQDAMLERRDALLTFESLVQDGIAIGLGQIDYTNPEVAADVNRKVEVIRQALSRTSDDTMRHALFILRHGESPPEVTREDTIRRLERAIEGCSDKDTGCVVPEAVLRLPDFFDEVARRIKPNIPEDDPFGDGVGEGYRECASVLRHKLDCAIAEQGGQRLPEDWKLVPVEPTDAMLATAEPAIDNYFEGTKDAPFEGSVRAVYQSMLAAAPQPKHGESNE